MDEGTTRGAESGLRSDWIESELRSYRIGTALRSLAEDLAQARRRIAVLERENRELRAQIERLTGQRPEAAGQRGQAATTSNHERT